MPGVNFRNTYGFDPYGMEGGGGLLGMLQAMYQGQAGPGADLKSSNGRLWEVVRSSDDCVWASSVHSFYGPTDRPPSAARFRNR